MNFHVVFVDFGNVKEKKSSRTIRDDPALLSENPRVKMVVGLTTRIKDQENGFSVAQSRPTTFGA